MFSRVAVSAFLLASMVACQSAPKPTSPAPRPLTPAPTVAPSAPPPTPSPAEPRRVAVILGPGGAKALAHVGVLKSFQHQRIPIEKIVGLEWGALIAALYSDKGQTNDVEWKLYKMEQKGLPRPKGFFSKRLGEDSVSSMDEFLQEAFGNGEISRARVPFNCPSRSIWTGVVAWQTKGSLREAVKHCLPFPPLFKAQGTFLAGASQATEAIELLRREGFNVIVLVNVLGSAMPVAQDSLLDNLNHVILWQEIKRALVEATSYNVEVVNVDTSAYPMVQFESKKELISLGESAGGSAAQLLVNKYGF